VRNTIDHFRAIPSPCALRRREPRLCGGSMTPPSTVMASPGGISCHDGEKTSVPLEKLIRCTTRSPNLLPNSKDWAPGGIARRTAASSTFDIAVHDFRFRGRSARWCCLTIHPAPPGGEGPTRQRGTLPQAFSKTSPSGVYRTTPDGRTLLANPRASAECLVMNSYEELAAHNMEEHGGESTYVPAIQGRMTAPMDRCVGSRTPGANMIDS